MRFFRSQDGGRTRVTRACSTKKPAGCRFAYRRFIWQGDFWSIDWTSACSDSAAAVIARQMLPGLISPQQAIVRRVCRNAGRDTICGQLKTAFRSLSRTGTPWSVPTARGRLVVDVSSLTVTSVRWGEAGKPNVQQNAERLLRPPRPNHQTQRLLSRLHRAAASNSPRVSST